MSVGALIPESNRLEASYAARGPQRLGLLESSYGSGFVGAFGDSDDHPEWARRANRWLRAEFHHDTDGEHFFSDVVGELTATGDGECHMDSRHALEAWQSGGKQGVEPYNTQQDYGSCVDASHAEMTTALLGYRAAKMSVNERYAHPAAWYLYAARGYCSDGWDGWGIATQAKRLGVAFRIAYDLGGKTVDFTDDDRNERIVARDWCRSGPPSWLVEHTKTNHAWDATAITEFGDGGLPELKKLFAAGGCLHFSGTRTSGSSKPFVWGSVGPHMMTAYGYDDSEAYRKFCRDTIGVPARDNDFPIQCGQTWGAGWRGECADQYWPSWWGPKPQGAWVCWASEFRQKLSLDMAYLPRVKGFPGNGPQPTPDLPQIDGKLYAERIANGAIAIRGELKTKDGSYIAVPDGSGAYRVIPKPIA